MHPRQRKDKFRPYALCGNGVDMLPMGCDNLFHDRKSQAGALFVFAPGGISLVEALPDFLHAVPGNADALILYRDKYLFVPQGCLDGDDRIVRTELDGVIQKVVHNLLNFAHICGHKLLSGVEEQLHGNVAGRTAALEGGYRILDDGVDIEIGDIQPVFLGVEGI